jgi:hypothetical protein
MRARRQRPPAAPPRAPRLVIRPAAPRYPRQHECRAGCAADQRPACRQSRACRPQAGPGIVARAELRETLRASRNVDSCKRRSGTSANGCALPVAHRSGSRAAVAGVGVTGPRASTALCNRICLRGRVRRRRPRRRASASWEHGALYRSHDRTRVLAGAELATALAATIAS